MKWTRKRRWLTISGCFALALLVVQLYVANTLIAPFNHPVGPPPNDLPAVVTTIASESGSQLATWYIPAENSHATIILLHPKGADRRTMLPRAKLFHQAGYTIVMIDQQAHGESPGDHFTIGFLERYDVRAAVAYARQMNPDHRIGIDGWSLGAAATLLATPLAVDAIVLEAPYSSISEAVDNRIRKRLGSLSNVLTPVLLWELRLWLGISPADLRPIDHIAEIGCPVLIFAGDQDQGTTLAQTKDLFDAASEPKKLVVFEGAEHVDFFGKYRAQYESEVLPFLATYLGPPSVDHKTTDPPF